MQFYRIKCNLIQNIMALKIKEFPKDSNFWIVDAVTHIKKNHNVDSEPLAQVLCSEIIDTATDPFLGSNRTQNSCSFWVGVGQLAKLRFGSLWQDKKCIQIPLNDKPYITEKSFEIDTNKIIKTKWSHPVTINKRTFFPIPFKALNVGKNFERIKHSMLYIVPCEDTSTILIIPSYVLLSSYYIPSSKIARAVFANNIDSLIVNDESKKLENGDVKLILRKNCDDNDRYQLARWKASEVMNTEITNMVKRIQTHNINTAGLGTSTQTEGAILDIGFPFKGHSTLTVTGKFILLDETNQTSGTKKLWGFLVFAINECTHPYPYKKIHYDRHNDNSQVEGSDPTKPAWSGVTSGGGSTKDEDDDEHDSEVGSDDETNRNPTINIVLPGTKFPDLHNIEIIKTKKTTQTSKADKNNKKDKQSDSDQYGTGEPTSQDTSTDPLNIRQDNNPDALRVNLPIGIVNFFKAINHIRLTKDNKHNERWILNSITYDNRGWKIKVDMQEERLSAFPIKIKKCVSWHLKYKNAEDIDKSIPRAIAIIQVKINYSKTVYLLEMERKNEADAHCLIIIRNQNYSTIESHIMNSFLRATARKNRWAFGFNNLYFHKIEHRHKSTDDFANNIINAIINF